MEKRIYTQEQKERKRLYDIEYRKKNAEKKKEQSKQWREENAEKKKQLDKEYYEKNKDVKREYDIEYRKKNAELKKERDKEYYQKNKENIKNNAKEYRENNRDKINLYHTLRRANDPLYKLICNIRSSIRQAFKRKGLSKPTKTEIILGCSFDEFRTHIESLWQPWMNWDNYGLYNGTPNYGWDIDHIIPLATTLTIEDVIKLNHYTNLQPLCSYYNRDIKIDNLI